ncbi:MAG: hypothetical protein A2057_09635 [Ignavibacteria bacterium GWA2_35_9]|nr:MAG: hypothetical protein A2057_09635 [Ignavibacteria bacterium GWA2_35_9]OGU43940.1 MAG: hypothetical protein A2000_00910 [Ignavibacteria bacterium GWB2_36_8]OGU53749.1 MAG: hypothetical protein A2080_05990 [Ignavibacteria bacterium GWC2_36_12]
MNFGHVIFESLYFGTPVICSGTTAWDKLDEFNASWNIKLDKSQQYVTLIENLILLDDDSYCRYLKGCKVHLDFLKNEKDIIKNNLLLFEN